MTARIPRRIADRVRGAGSSAAASDGGFTLIEAVVSFALFVVISTSAIYSITNALQASHRSQRRVDAANVAQEVVAQARAAANANTVHPDSGTSYTIPVGNGTGASLEQFTYRRWIVFSAVGATECSAGTTFTVNVEVYQGTTASASNFLARSDSVVACPPA